ncbi:MAG TPA: hypothetical protein VHB51_01230 [Candidatus Saccharimonadales bacterium]|nr:hypothetical protein [Candidatus Saccharimonadales bacterium]
MVALVVRQLYLVGTLLTALIMLAPAVAEAHELKEDNGIAAVMHIEPNDIPLAGQNTQLEFAFGDRQDAFNLANCVCGARLVAAGKTIQQLSLHPAQAGSTLAAKASVRFPDIGKYKVVLAGHATDNSFPSFTVDFPVDVTASAQNAASKKTAVTIEISTILLAVLVIGTVLFASRRKR